MTDSEDGENTSYEDPFFSDEPEDPAAGVKSDPSLQEPGGAEGRPMADELPPPPDDHADYGLVAAPESTSPVTPPPVAPPPVTPPPVAPPPVAPPVMPPAPEEQVADVPLPTEPAAPSAPAMNWQAPPAYPPPEPAAPAPPVAPEPVIPPPVVPPLMLDQASDMPAIMATAAPGMESTAPVVSGMESAPPVVETTEPLAPAKPLLADPDEPLGDLPGQSLAQPAATGAPLLGAIPVASPGEAGLTADREGAGLQGPEFQALRAEGMQVPMASVAPVVEERLQIASEFSAKPSTLHGKSPISLSSRTTRLGIAAVAVLVAIFLIIQLIPHSSTKGTELAFSFAEGKSADYHAHMAYDATITGDIPASSLKIIFDADVAMKPTQVGADGTATIDVTTTNIRATTTVHAVGATIPASQNSTLTVQKDGAVTAGGLGLATATGAGDLSPPGWDSSFPILPKTGVMPGDTWTGKTVVLFEGQDLTTNITYTFLSESKDPVAGKVAAISVKGTMPVKFTIPFADAVVAQGGSVRDLAFDPGEATVKYDGTMAMDGTVWVKLDDMSFQGSYTTSQVEMTVSTSGMPPEAGGDGSAKIKGDLTYSLRAAEAGAAPVTDPKQPSPEIKVGQPAV